MGYSNTSRIDLASCSFLILFGAVAVALLQDGGRGERPLYAEQVGHHVVGAARRAAGVEEEDAEGDDGISRLLGQGNLASELET